MGTYRLRYADETSAELPLRLGRNIALVEHTPAQSRYVQDCRAVLPLADDQSAARNQLEWVNPHPEKVALHLDIESFHESAPLLVAAVTARSVRDDLQP